MTWTFVTDYSIYYIFKNKQIICNSNLPCQKWLSQTIEIMSSDQNFVHILMQIHQSVINERSHFQKGRWDQNRYDIIWCQFWFFLS